MPLAFYGSFTPVDGPSICFCFWLTYPPDTISLFISFYFCFSSIYFLLTIPILRMNSSFSYCNNFFLFSLSISLSSESSISTKLWMPCNYCNLLSNIRRHCMTFFMRWHISLNSKWAPVVGHVYFEFGSSLK